MCVPSRNSMGGLFHFDHPPSRAKAECSREHRIVKNAEIRQVTKVPAVENLVHQLPFMDRRDNISKQVRVSDVDLVIRKTGNASERTVRARQRDAGDTIAVNGDRRGHGKKVFAV